MVNKAKIPINSGVFAFYVEAICIPFKNSFQTEICI